VGAATTTPAGDTRADQAPRADITNDPDRHLHRQPNGTTLIVNRFSDRSDIDQNRWMEASTDEMCAMKEPFALIQDMRDLTKMSPIQRAHYATLRERLQPVYAKYKVLTVYVVRDPQQRGFLTAIGWISSPSTTSGRQFCETLEEATRLCLDALGRNVRAR
jgi:hypothetical protein